MMTSPNGNIFNVTGHLCGEFTGHRWILRTKASGAELWHFFICAWINGWVNDREAGDFRRHRPHYDIIVMRPREISHGTENKALPTSHFTKRDKIGNGEQVEWLPPLAVVIFRFPASPSLRMRFFCSVVMLPTGRNGMKLDTTWYVAKMRNLKRLIRLIITDTQSIRFCIWYTMLQLSIRRNVATSITIHRL